jgi:uncharacterized OsmC-like protein
MDNNELRALQAPLKEKYRDDPSTAKRTLTAAGDLQPDLLICNVATDLGVAGAGLHPATGGDGTAVCSGDMLLQALVACAGVTMTAVATAMEIEIKGGTVTAEGDLDFRGTLGIDKDAKVGFSDIRLVFDVETDAAAEKLDTLLRLTERYCVVFQTLTGGPSVTAAYKS